MFSSRDYLPWLPAPAAQIVFAVSTLLALATSAPAVAEAPPADPPPAAIVSVRVTGDVLVVEVATRPSSGEEPWFDIRQLGSDGAVLDAASFTPAADGGLQTVTLDLAFTTIANLGWQRRLEIFDTGGSLVDRLDVRLGLDCAADGSACRVVATAGLLIENAVALSAGLATHLGAAGTVDFATLNRAQPALRAAIFETSVDLATRLPGPPAGCRCFYSADVPLGGGGAYAVVLTALAEGPDTDAVQIDYRWSQLFSSASRFRAGDEAARPVQIGFRCFETTALTASQIVTSSGVLLANLPALAPCPAGCASPVEWSLVDLDCQTTLDPEGGSGVEASYQLDWSVGGADVFSASGAWALSGTPLATVVHQGTDPTPAAPIVVAQTPSQSRITAASTAEIHNWSTSDLPAVAVSAGATLQARGLAPCAPPALVIVQPTYGLCCPSSITIVLGPGIDP